MQSEDLRLFVATIQAGSFTAAAERLGLSKQYVSRRTMALEAALGVRLLNRSTRRLNATDLGLALYERAVKILEDLDEAQELVSNQSKVLRGTLRIAAPMTFGTLHLGPVLPLFMQRHPQLHIELDLNDRKVDLIAEGYDMALRGGAMEDSSLIARRLVPVGLIACASPQYLARHGEPAVPDDLAHHACLLFGHGRTVEWIFSVDGKPRALQVGGQLRANNGEVVRDAAIAGAGIAYLPNFIAEPAIAQGLLVPILQAYSRPDAAVYAVYPQHRQASRAVQAFVEFAREHLMRPREAALAFADGLAPRG